MDHPAAEAAERIWAARQAGRTLDAEATIGSPDLATAYAIQAHPCSASSSGSPRIALATALSTASSTWACTLSA